MSPSPSPSLRKRGAKQSPESEPATDASFSSGQGKMVEKRQSEWDYRIALIIVTALAFITRFYKISHPAEVVFDEVHFGKVGS